MHFGSCERGVSFFLLAGALDQKGSLVIGLLRAPMRPRLLLAGFASLAHSLPAKEHRHDALMTDQKFAEMFGEGASPTSSRAAAAQQGGGKSSDEGKVADRHRPPPAASSAKDTASSKFDDAAIGSATQHFRNELRRVVQSDAPAKAKRGGGRSSGSSAAP